jgi:hypothetical protein
MKPWYEEPALWMTAAAVGAAFLFVERKAVIGSVNDVFERGDRLTYGVMDPQRGIIVTSPDDLLNAAESRLGYAIDQDIYALARMIRSEGAVQGEARAHVAINDLARLQWSSLFDLLTYSTAKWAKGLFGKQASFKFQSATGGETWKRSEAAHDNDDHPIILDKQVRRYSTAQDPYAGDVLTARKAIADAANGIDPTNGAVKFLDKTGLLSQDGASSFERVNARWTKEGLVAFTLPAYGDDLVLYRRA